MSYIEYNSTTSLINRLPKWLSIRRNSNDPFRLFINHTLSAEESTISDQEYWLSSSLFPLTCDPAEPYYYYTCYNSGIYSVNNISMLASGTATSLTNNDDATIGGYFSPQVGTQDSQVTVYRKDTINDFLTNVPTRIEYNGAWYKVPSESSGILGISYANDLTTNSGVFLVLYNDSPLADSSVQYYYPHRNISSSDTISELTKIGNFPCWYLTQSFAATGRDEFLTLENVLGTGIYFDYNNWAAYAQTATLAHDNVVSGTLSIYDYINTDASGVARLVDSSEYTVDYASGIVYFPTGVRPSYSASGSSNYTIDPGWNSQYLAEYNYYTLNTITDITNKGKFHHCPSNASGLLLSGYLTQNEIEIPYYEAFANSSSGVVASGDLVLYTQPKYLFPGSTVNCVFYYGSYVETPIASGSVVTYDVASEDSFAYLVDSSGVIVYPSGSTATINMFNKYTVVTEVSGGWPSTEIAITYPSGSPGSDEYYLVDGISTPRPLMARIHYKGKYEINDITTASANIASGSYTYYDYDIDNSYNGKSLVVPRTIIHLQASGVYTNLRDYSKVYSTVKHAKQYSSIAYNPNENLVYLLDATNHKVEIFKEGNKLSEYFVNLNYEKPYSLPTSKVYDGIDFNLDTVSTLGAIAYSDSLLYYSYTANSGLSYIVGVPASNPSSRFGVTYGTTESMLIPDLPTSMCFDMNGNLLIAANYKLYGVPELTGSYSEVFLEFKKYYDYYLIQNNKFIFREYYDSTQAGIQKWEDSWNIVDEHLLNYGLSRFTGESNIDALKRLSKRMWGLDGKHWGTSVQGLTNALNNEFGFDSFNMNYKNVFFLTQTPLKYDPATGTELPITVAVNGSGLSTRFFEYAQLPLGWEIPSGCNYSDTYFDEYGEKTDFYAGWILWHNSDGTYSRILELSASGIIPSGAVAINYYYLNNRGVAETITDTSDMENPYDTFYVYQTPQRITDRVNVYTLTNDYINSNLMASGSPTAEFLRLSEQTRTVSSLLYKDAVYGKTPYDSLDAIKFGYDIIPINFDVL